MKKILGLSVVCFAVALAVVVAYRMSAEAMGVVIGVVCGVLASIPMSLLILVINQRQRRQEEENHWATPQQRSTPPVVVIQGGTPLQRPEWSPFGSQAMLGMPSAQANMTPFASNTSRQFKVIGEDWNTDER